MDSIISWFLLCLLANVGFFLAIKKAISEKKENRAKNDDVFRTLNR